MLGCPWQPKGLPYKFPNPKQVVIAVILSGDWHPGGGEPQPTGQWENHHF